MANAVDILLNPPNLKEYSFTPARPEDLKVEQGALGFRFPPGASDMTSAPVAPGKDTGNAVRPPPYIRIIWFSKVHYVSVPLYERDAYLYNQYHWSEACILLDSIHGQKQIYSEWVNPDGWIQWAVGGTSEGAAKLMEWFGRIKKAPKPDPNEFRKLTGRTMDVLERISKNDLDCKVVALNGLELALIREDLRRLLVAISKFRENAIAGAEATQVALESVESTSFQVLNVAPTILMMDPFREAAYKITMAIVNAGARGIGGALARESTDAFVQETWSKLKKDIPGVVADVMLIPIGRYVGKLGWGPISKDVLNFVIQLIIEFVTGMWAVAWQAKDGKITRNDLYRQLVQSASSIFGKIVERVFKIHITTPNSKVAIATSVEAVAKVLVTDIYQAIKIAEDQHRDLGEVLLHESPSTIMKIFEAAIVGFAQRKGAQYKDLVQHNRLGSQLASDEAMILAKGVTASDIWNTKPARSTFRKIRESRSRIGQFTKYQYDHGPWRQTNLEYYTAANLRRYSDECNMWCFYRAPNETRLNHTADRSHKGAKWAKPMTVHAKSANHKGLPPDIRGLVMKPSNGTKRPETHKDYDGAKSQWNDYLHEFRNSGNMVRSDGVAFHPDQILAWGKLNGWDNTKYKKTFDLLVEMQKSGIYDFTNDADADQLQRRADFHAQRKVSPEDWNIAESTMRNALIGYYSDLDPIDFVDAKTGKSMHFGNKENQGMDLARANRAGVNEYISRDLDGEMIDTMPRNSGAPGTGENSTPTRIEQPESEIQHGGSEQMLGRAINLNTDEKVVKLEDGCFAVGPDDKLVIFQNRVPADELAKMGTDERATAIHKDLVAQWQALLRQEIGPNVKSHDDRMNDIQKDYEQLSLKVKKVKQKAPKIEVPDVEEVNGMHMPVSVIDIDGLGHEISFDTLSLGLMKRNLLVSHHKLRDIFLNDWGSSFGPQGKTRDTIFDDAAKGQCRIGIDAFGANVVIAVTHYRQTLAECILQLLKCRRMLGNIPTVVNNLPLAIWYEIHTAYQPVTTEFIAGRIGQPESGVRADKSTEPFADQCPTFKKHASKLHFAFATRGRVAAYTPGPMIKLRHRYFGFRLADIWEDRKTLQLDWSATTITDAAKDGGDKCEIAVFTSPIYEESGAMQWLLEVEGQPARRTRR